MWIVGPSLNAATNCWPIGGAGQGSVDHVMWCERSDIRWLDNTANWQLIGKLPQHPRVCCIAGHAAYCVDLRRCAVEGLRTPSRKDDLRAVGGCLPRCL